MPYGDLLFQRLNSAKRDELEDIVEVLRLKKDDYEHASDADLVNALSRELRSAAGNSLRNTFRNDHDLAYRRILIDVADKLAPGRSPWRSSKYTMDSDHYDADIEDHIYRRFMKIVEDNLAKMSDKKRAEVQATVQATLKAKGFTDGVVASSGTAIAAGGLTGAALGPVVAAAVFGGFWTGLFGLSLGALLAGASIVGLPAGLLAGGVWVLGGTAYRKTVPAVLRIIHVRKTREAEATLKGDSE